MKKEICLLSVIMIAALVMASILAPVLQKKQNRINPDRNQLSKIPVGGMHKVVSDWEWMRFINYLGNQSVVDDKNVNEVTERLERLIGLDPKFERLYLDGLSSIQHANPKKAIELLEKACRMEYLKDNWKIPFYTGFILSRDTYDINDPNGEPLLAADHAKAAGYFLMAIHRFPGTPDRFIVNNYIREQAKAEAVGTAPDREFFARLRVLYRIWCKFHNIQPDWKLGQDEEYLTAEKIPDLDARLLSALQDAKNPRDIYDQHLPPSKESLALIDRIRREAMEGRNLCTKCLYPTRNGEKFCTHCGSENPFVHGVCSQCAMTLPESVKFCPNCGRKVEVPKPSPVPRQIR